MKENGSDLDVARLMFNQVTKGNKKNKKKIKKTTEKTHLPAVPARSSSHVRQRPSALRTRVNGQVERKIRIGRHVIRLSLGAIVLR